MTPLALKMLIHFCCHPAEVPFPDIERDPQKHILKWFLTDGVIDRLDFPSATPKGKAWLALILETPMPEQQWIDPRTGKGIAPQP